MEREISLDRHGEGRGPAEGQVVRGVYYLRDRIVNLYLVGDPRADVSGGGRWVLVDAGLPGVADRIVRAAESRFGVGARPEAIVMTHGHFDHTGALKTLAERWDVPVYAHTLELPYLTGRSKYPPPDPTVGKGSMPFFARTFPRGPIDLGARVQPLPEDGSVPGMDGWRWIFTPGHTAGHVSFFRDNDRTLIAGDAFVTTKQESAMSVLTQRREVNGPPAYFTQDWGAARDSVRKLAELNPNVAATGHGLPMSGGDLHRELDRLARDFDRLALPKHGRYVDQPAIADESGTVSVPPPVADPVGRIVAGVAIAAVAAALLRNRGGESRS
ncbi:MAG TPA: MBL fold metallo-hydrolase [Gemmatimonadaceae bacterium]|nr:MBL fold metallo-hydrolase [Gemmatimonadaceae bacterium]